MGRWGLVIWNSRGRMWDSGSRPSIPCILSLIPFYVVSHLLVLHLVVSHVLVSQLLVSHLLVSHLLVSNVLFSIQGQVHCTVWCRIRCHSTSEPTSPKLRFSKPTSPKLGSQTGLIRAGPTLLRVPLGISNSTLSWTLLSYLHCKDRVAKCHGYDSLCKEQRWSIWRCKEVWVDDEGREK